MDSSASTPSDRSTIFFYNIVPNLTSSGATVFVSQVSASNSNAVRGEQLLAELRRLQATYGYSKFNLIGHSQGGQDVRYVAAVAPAMVASVTTVSTPHMGTPVADDVLAIVKALGVTGFAQSFINGLSSLIDDLSGHSGLPQDSLAALQSLTASGAAAINAQFPAGMPTTPCGSGPESVNGIHYFSAGGTALYTNVFDLSDYVLGVTAPAFLFSPNDGLVGQCSNHWGTVLRDNYLWNHLDAVNQLFGLVSPFAANPVSFYRAQANRLQGLGL